MKIRTILHIEAKLEGRRGIVRGGRGKGGGTQRNIKEEQTAADLLALTTLFKRRNRRKRKK